MTIKLEYSRSIEITSDQIKEVVKEFNDDLDPGDKKILSEVRDEITQSNYEEYIEEGGNDPEDVTAFLEWLLGRI